MLKQTLKKIFLKRKLLLAVLLLVLIETGIGVFEAANAFPTELDRATYQRLVSHFAGPLSDAKRAELETEQLLFENARELQEYLTDAVRSSVIDPEDYQNDSALLSAYLRGRGGYEAFLEDVSYAESGTDRQLVNRVGWTFLLGKERVDILLCMVLLLFVIVSEVSENETNFRLLRRTTVFGKKKTHILNVTVGVCLAAALSAVIMGIRFLLAWKLLGLTGGSAPAESLSMFQNTAYGSLTVSQAFLFVSGIRILGAMGYTALCFLFGAVFLSSLTAALGGVLTVILPPYILSSPALYYVSPVSLLLGSGFLFGRVSETVGEQEEKAEIVFSVAAGKPALYFSVIFAVLLIFSALLFAERKEENRR